MAYEYELKNWVKSLSPSEKRFISLIGKARSGSGSQLLELFDWLNKSREDEEVPVKASFRANLPTLAVRLRELILDSLRLLNKEKDIDARLRTALDETGILQSKKHWQAAARQIRKTKKLAYETSRYIYVLQCIEAELIQIQQLPPDQVSAAFAELQMEEQSAIEKQLTLSKLRFRHDSIMALAQQFPFSRNPEIIEQVKILAGAAIVLEQVQSEAYLENALAVNTLGISDLFLRTPEHAVERYRRLLETWKAKNEWQADQPVLLMAICKYYQNACFFSTSNQGILHSDLLSLKDFDGLPPEKLRTFRETMFHHKFILSLNSGKLGLALDKIPEIEEWLKSETSNLSEAQVLPFLCNFLVTEFLSGRFAEANKYLQRILNLPNRKARVDIREFAIILQPVIQYELGNTGLNEYLTRSGKRHFSKNVTNHGFELIVLKKIDMLMNAGGNKQKGLILQEFITELEKMNENQQSSVPLLGLNEIYMWTKSRKNNVPLQKIFMEEVKKAHALAEPGLID